MEESLKSDDNFAVVDKEEVLKKLLEILKPGETIGKVTAVRMLQWTSSIYLPHTA